MLRPTPRLIWSSACVACLGAVAGALFWPAQDIPRLRPVITAQTRDFAAASAGLRAAATPESLTAPTSAVQEQASGETPDEAQTPSGSADESIRDAVADGPWRAAPTQGDLAQAPWHAYWGITKRETAAVPAPQALPITYRRSSKGGGPRAAAQAKGVRVLRSDAEAGKALSPDKAERRMAELLRRIRAGRAASAPQETGTSRSDGRQPGQKMKGARAGAATSSPRGRGAHSEASPRAMAEPKIKTEPKPKAEPKAKILKSPQLRPVLLSKVLGINAIRPPKAGLKAPDFSRLARAFPKTGPDGRPVSRSAPDAKTLEAMRPPSETAADCRARGRHWHSGPEPLYHEGQAWGLQHDGGWLWLKKSNGDWWASTSPQEPAMLWHAEHWWWRSDGVWFMLHDGEAWGYRLFGERRAEGLIHPRTGTQMEYSADGKRVAMITPGDGAWLFDAQSGAVMDRWTEAQMPAKPKPHAPRALSLPP